jgi:hypothetical protein
MVENCTHVGTFDGLSKLSEGRLVGLLNGVIVGIPDTPWEGACDGFISVSFGRVIEGRLLGLLDGAVVGTIGRFLNEIYVAIFVGLFGRFSDRRLLAIINGVVVCSMDGSFEDHG